MGIVTHKPVSDRGLRRNSLDGGMAGQCGQSSVEARIGNSLDSHTAIVFSIGKQPLYSIV